MVRIFIAGILGGVVMFIGGAFSHMFLELESRQFKRLPSESAARDFFTQQALRTGMYSFPEMAENYATMSATEKDADAKRVNDEFKTGPAGMLIVAPTGEDLMGPKQLIGEFAANVTAALLAAFIAAHFTLAATYGRRLLLIVVLAPLSWLTLTLSFTLWYRFPLPFIQDGLFCALIEWSLAGAVIAAIVRPIMHNRA